MPLPPIGDLLTAIVESFDKLGKTVSAGRAESVRSHLASVLSNIKADENDIVISAKIKENQKKAAELATMQESLRVKTITGQ